MSSCQHILVVEDEGLIAMHIDNTLKSLGYEVSLATSADEALESAAKQRPDLALLDIVLSGGNDGVETASELSRRFGIPFVYLTGHSDERTVERVKNTEPLGYLLKPFHERQLAATIEIALRRHATESMLRTGHEWSTALLEAVRDAVIITDAQKKVSFMNAASERFTGCAPGAGSGREVAALLDLLGPQHREELDTALTRALSAGEPVEFSEREAPIRGAGGESYRADRIVSFRAAGGAPVGATIIFRRVEGPESGANTLERASHAPVRQEIDLEDPLTGLPSRAQAERDLAAAVQQGRPMFVAVFAIERLEFLVRRFGSELAEQVVQFYGVFLAQGLAPGDKLYRWNGQCFAALLEKGDSVESVRREIARIGSVRVERVFEVHARTALLFIGSDWTVIPVLPGDSAAAIVLQVDNFVAANQRRA